MKELLLQIRTLLQNARYQLQQTVNSVMVQTYWEIGKLIIEDEQNGSKRATYGTQQIRLISQQLYSEFGKGFTERNIRSMRQFYRLFPIWHSVSTKLSWTHYRTLIRIDNEKARQWYLHEAIEQNWSVRALDRQISKFYYERLLSSTNLQPVIQEANKKIEQLQLEVKDYLRDPYILDFLNLPYKSILESDIEQSLIENLQEFLLELGKGFAFVARQKRISTEDQDFYIDLVFYNFKLKCFLLIDLKLNKLTHQDIGQMDTYVRIYDEKHKNNNDNPTIGLILCSEKSETLAKYSVLNENKQIFASKYLPYLPSEEDLIKELAQKRASIEHDPKYYE